MRLGDPRFSLVPVPDAAPRTKPKALDFALPLCQGQYVVVFDAEDIPDPDQLWKAALRFQQS
nr:family 2 glycosyl transferase [Pseudomonas sp.]